MATINGTPGNDTLIGTSGRDEINGFSGDDSLTGNEGNDTLVGDVLLQSVGNDYLDGGAGADELLGHEGNDVLVWDADDVLLSGSSGLDVLRLVGSGVSADLTRMDDFVALDIEIIDVTGSGNNNVTLALEDVESIATDTFVLRIDGNAGDTVTALDAGNWAQQADQIIDGNTYSLFTAASASLYVDSDMTTNMPNGEPTEDTLIGGASDESFHGGRGNDSLEGNGGNDTLIGGRGNDMLRGGAGDDYLDNLNFDTLEGGTGDDTYVLRGGNVVVENPGEGIDTVRDSIGRAMLPANVERLILTSQQAAGHGNGNAGNNEIIGVARFFNHLFGFDGNDTLIGGKWGDHLTGGAGNDSLVGGADGDSMIGGPGDDTYVVDETVVLFGGPDEIIENAGEGTDLVRHTGSVTLGENVENLALLNGGNRNGTGNELVNLLTGNTGSNRLEGRDGNDTLIGGAGNDTLDGGGGVMDFASYRDVAAGSGGVTASLANGTGVASDDGHGNTDMLASIEGLEGSGDSDAFTGAAGSQWLSGRGGNDTLNGGIDLDWVTHRSDVSGVTINLAAGAAADGFGGTDTLIAIENAEGSDQADSIAGNSGVNELRGRSGNDTLGGGAGNDTLDGGDGNDSLDGGDGNDSLSGGAGDDTYVYGSGDVIAESAGAGTDTVRSSGSFTLGADLENLKLLGTGDRNGTGNAQNNALTGNDGNNRLRGNDGDDTLLGGAGNDTLEGGAGNDIFRFTAALDGATNVDVISDFDPAGEVLRLDDAVFTGLVSGTLDADAFTTGSDAQDAEDRIIYDDATGAVLFDSDGSGTAAAIHFATLSAGLAITANDFVVV